MQDRPDTHELAAALAEFLMEEVRPAVGPELRFPILVAANAGAILARESEAGQFALRDEAARLRALDPTPAAVAGVDAEGVRAARARVARAIREGSLDDRWEEVLAAVRESVRARLAIAHPGYDEVTDDGRA